MCNNARFTAPQALVLLAAAACGALVLARNADAQSTTYTACYVPSSGTIYRIKEPGLRQQCGTSEKNGTSEPHVEFSWVSAAASLSAAAAGGNGGGGAKEIDHGSLVGLNDDDHLQYIPINGVRTATGGFGLKGTLGSPSPLPDVSISHGTPLPALLWHAGKGAFRAGGVGDFGIVDGGTEWDDANVGNFSIGLGAVTTASGQYSVAAGFFANATGEKSAAFGPHTFAQAFQATAFGYGSQATGPSSIALGGVAGGEQSIAIGAGSNTNGRTGAIVISPFLPLQPRATAAADYQFVVRARSLWFGNNPNVTATDGRLIETSTGAYLSSGGAWVSSSDIAKKTEFQEVDGEAVLGNLTSMPIRTWRYKEEDAGVRHMGPTAQDFRAAFGLGDSDTAIAGIDADGVSLAAIQALAKRTNGVQQLLTLVREQDARIRELETALRALAAKLSTRSQH